MALTAFPFPLLQERDGNDENDLVHVTLFYRRAAVFTTFLLCWCWCWTMRRMYQMSVNVSNEQTTLINKSAMPAMKISVDPRRFS